MWDEADFRQKSLAEAREVFANGNAVVKIKATFGAEGILCGSRAEHTNDEGQYVQEFSYLLLLDGPYNYHVCQRCIDEWAVEFNRSVGEAMGRLYSVNGVVKIAMMENDDFADWGNVVTQTRTMTDKKVNVPDTMPQDEAVEGIKSLIRQKIGPCWSTDLSGITIAPVEGPGNV